MGLCYSRMRDGNLLFQGATLPDQEGASLGRNHNHKSPHPAGTNPTTNVELYFKSTTRDSIILSYPILSYPILGRSNTHEHTQFSMDTPPPSGHHTPKSLLSRKPHTQKDPYSENLLPSKISHPENPPHSPSPRNPPTQRTNHAYPHSQPPP